MPGVKDWGDIAPAVVGAPTHISPFIKKCLNSTLLASPCPWLFLWPSAACPAQREATSPQPGFPLHPPQAVCSSLSCLCFPSPLSSDLVSSCGSGCALFQDTLHLNDRGWGRLADPEPSSFVPLHLSDGGWVADPWAQFFVISPKPYREIMQNLLNITFGGCNNWRSIWNFYQ